MRSPAKASIMREGPALYAASNSRRFWKPAATMRTIARSSVDQRIRRPPSATVKGRLRPSQNDEPRIDDPRLPVMKKRAQAAATRPQNSRFRLARAARFRMTVFGLLEAMAGFGAAGGGGGARWSFGLDSSASEGSGASIF